MFYLFQSSRITNASGDACERRDPCQHGGVCISTDDGPICECRDGDYEGAFCERGMLSIVIILRTKFTEKKV